MKPDKNPGSLYVFAAGIAGQVGCFLTLIVGGSVLLGLLLDKILKTGHTFLILLLLASIPLNILATYRYTLYRSKRLQATSQNKEDGKSED